MKSVLLLLFLFSNVGLKYKERKVRNLLMVLLLLFCICPSLSRILFVFVSRQQWTYYIHDGCTCIGGSQCKRIGKQISNYAVVECVEPALFLSDSNSIRCIPYAMPYYMYDVFHSTDTFGPMPFAIRSNNKKIPLFRLTTTIRLQYSSTTSAFYASK